MEWKPLTANDLGRMTAENFSGSRLPLLPAGGRTALRYGEPLKGTPTIVSLTELNRVIDYPSRDQTITVEAGIRLEELRTLLRAEQQQIAVDLPQSHRATLGGALAVDACGPSCSGSGTLRDYVIGISAIDGQGRLFSAGGRVVKNVAGYDLCKLLIGSLGTLAIITQVTLKLRPAPEDRSFACVPLNPNEVEPALTLMNRSAARPVIVDLLNAKAVWQLSRESRFSLPTDCSLLCVGFAGASGTIRWEAEQVLQELGLAVSRAGETIRGDEAGKLWSALTEYQTASDDPLTFRAWMLPSVISGFVRRATESDVAIQAHAGAGIVIGHLPDRCSDAAAAWTVLQNLRSLAEQGQGRLIVTQCDEDWKRSGSVFGTPWPAARLMRGIKQALDPAGVLSPGRMGSVLG